MLDEIPLEGRIAYREHLATQLHAPDQSEGPQEYDRALARTPEAIAEAERMEAAWAGETHDGGV